MNKIDNKIISFVIDETSLEKKLKFSNENSVSLKAKNNKINYLLTICTTLESFNKIELIVKEYKNIYGTFGIHPHETEKNTHI